jgi:hypothetical protein
VVDVIHPHWSARAFLVYAAGLVALGALEGWFAYFGARWSGGAYAGASLGLLAATAAVALALKRAGRPVAAGVLAFVMLIALVAFLTATWKWFGWTTAADSSGLRGFHLARLLLALIWFVATIAALRPFRFPLLVPQAIFAGWFFVTDLLSNGGGWSAVVTLFVGLVCLGIAVAVDGGPSRPYGFWLHVGAGVLIGGSLLWFWHGGDFEWVLIAVAAIVYILFADAVERSSWAVLGTIGLLIAATHFTLEWTHVQLLFFNGGEDTTRNWVPPLVLTCIAFVLLALGLRGRRGLAQVGQQLS